MQRLKAIKLALLLTLTLAKTLAFATGENEGGDCDGVFEKNSSIVKEFDVWAKLGFDVRGLAILKKFVDAGLYSMPKARKIIQTGDARDFNSDLTNLAAGIDPEDADRIYYHFQSPFTGEKVGSAEPITLFSGAEAKLGSLIPGFTVQEFVVPDLEERPQTIAILAGQRPIAMIEFRLNGYKEMYVSDMEVASYARDFGIEVVLFNELLRRYPHVATADILIPSYSDAITSPIIRNFENLKEFVERYELGKINLIKQPVRPDIGRLKIRKAEPRNSFRGVGITKV